MSRIGDAHSSSESKTINSSSASSSTAGAMLLLEPSSFKSNCGEGGKATSTVSASARVWRVKRAKTTSNFAKFASSVANLR